MTVLSVTVMVFGCAAAADIVALIVTPAGRWQPDYQTMNFMEPSAHTVAVKRPES